MSNILNIATRIIAFILITMYTLISLITGLLSGICLSSDCNNVNQSYYYLSFIPLLILWTVYIISVWKNKIWLMRLAVFLPFGFIALAYVIEIILKNT